MKRAFGVFSALALALSIAGQAQEHEHHQHPTDRTDPSDMKSMHAMHAMPGMLGSYGMSREASGTAWQPESTPHDGVHTMWNGWDLMAHGFANLALRPTRAARGGAPRPSARTC